MSRESMEYDVVIVGAGPAGLSSSIRLKQLNPDLKVCIVEKGSEVGAHILSGAVFETKALDQLLPNWKELNAPIQTQVTSEEFLFLTDKSSFKLPTPPQMKNHGNYIISLGDLCKWLATQAENLGVEIYPGFAAHEVLIENDKVVGIATGDLGIDKNGNKKDSFQPGMELRAKYTLFGEGCRGSISEQLIEKFNLRQNCDPQTYGIGIKELWEINPELHKKGHVTHSVGWPLDKATYGGSFLYHMENNIISFGFVIGLDYQNPYIEPFQEMQRFKLHPKIKPLFKDAKRISYGARALNEGGFQSVPQLIFPGGALIGCSAGFLNVPKIKGSHYAMQSGMLAAEAVIEDFQNADLLLNSYPLKYKNSWIYKDLFKVRNIRPAFKKGLFRGMLSSAIDTYLFMGKAPWTKHNQNDHSELKKASNFKPIEYPPADGKITFDKLSSVQLSNTNHTEDQKCHLQLKNESIPVSTNLAEYAGLEQRYCPAGVYEFIVDENNNQKLQINSQNCVHCKTCDIKDPTQNIIWTTPEGGGGPRYSGM